LARNLKYRFSGGYPNGLQPLIPFPIVEDNGIPDKILDIKSK